MWFLLGAVVGPLSLLIHMLYPSRYIGRNAPCPRCGKPVGTRAVACHHCHYRFPAMDVLITKLPEDAESRRVLLSAVAREYGIAYADADRKVRQLPVAAYRHINPDEVRQHAGTLEALGARVEIVSSRPESERG